MNLLRRLHLFSAGALVIRLLPGWAALISHVKLGSFKTIALFGNAQFFNYSEKQERWTMALALLLSTLMAWGYLELCAVLRRRAPKGGWVFGLVAVALACGSLPTAEAEWQCYAIGFLALAFVPWSNLISTRLVNRIGAPVVNHVPLVTSAFIVAFSLTLLLRTRVFSAWEYPELPHPMASLVSLSIVFVFFYLGATSLLRRVRRTSTGFWIEGWFALAPLLPLGKIIGSAIAFSFEAPGDAVFAVERGLIAGAVAYLGIGGIAFILERACPLPRDSRLPARLLAYFSFPLLVYFASYEVNLRGVLDGWHDGLLYKTILDIKNGGVPYNGLFVLHGVGNSWMGTLGMKLWGENIAAFRLAYHFLAPLVWVLFFYILRFFLGRSGNLTAFLATFTAAAISSLTLPYAFFVVSWLGGTRAIVSLVVLAMLTAVLNPRFKIWLTATRAIGFTITLAFACALSLWINMEQGVAIFGAVLFTLPILVFHRKRSPLPVFTTILIFAVVYFSSVTLLFLPFTPPKILLSGLQYHIFDYPFRHEEAWGLPLLSPVNGSAHTAVALHRFYIFLPLLLIAWGGAHFAQSLRRRRVVGVWQLLLPFIVYTGLVYQIGLSRSDTLHLRMGLGISGILFCVLLYAFTDRRSFFWIVLVIYFAQGFFGRGMDLERQWWVKDQREVDRHALEPAGTEWAQVPLSPLVEGRYSVIAPKTREYLASLRQFTSTLPGFDGRVETTLAEQRPIYQIFLGWRQSELWDNPKPTVAMYQTWNFDPSGLPRYAKWLFQSHQVHHEFVPCFSVAPGIALLTHRKLLKSCPRVPIEELQNLFPASTDIRYLPSTLVRDEKLVRMHPYLEMVVVKLKEPAVREEPAAVKWNCSNENSPFPYKQMAFQLVPGMDTYWVPVSSNPAWIYCKTGAEDFRFWSESRRPLAHPLRLCHVSDLTKSGDCAEKVPIYFPAEKVAGAVHR